MEVLGFDKLTDSNNSCGISYFELFQDEKPIYNCHLSTLSSSKSRSYYTYLNYQEKFKTGERFHKLYIDNGNDLDFYSKSPNDGVLSITGETEIKAIFKDPYDNSTELTFKTKDAIPSVQPVFNRVGIEVIDNTLIFTAAKPTPANEVPVTYFIKGEKFNTLPYQEKSNLATYLIDLRKGLIDSILFQNKTFFTGLTATIPSSQSYSYYSQHMNLRFEKDDLFDTLFLKSTYTVGSKNEEIFEIGRPSEPLKKSIQVELFPHQKYEGDGWSVYSRDDNGNLYYVGGKWELNKLKFSTSFFGKYTIAKDSTPPKITPITLSNSRVSFRITDNLSGINDIQLTVNGQWILMYHDAKTSRIWSVLPPEIKTLKGELVLIVTDNENNTQTYKTTL